MRNQEKKTSKKTQNALLAIANFTNQVSGASNYQTIHQDYQAFFNALMLTDDADDSKFRDQAFLMLQFTKFFSESFSNIDWRDTYQASEDIKDFANFKLQNHEE